MTKRPYFSITRDAFEKNAGYKTTVHALAELIDNAYEANASHVAVVLMVDRANKLKRIATVDNGKGMDAELLQMAMCEKAGTYLDRKHGGGPDSRKKLGKYGVGLPKASISQCNHFEVWSWTSDGPSEAHYNQVNITDDEWIKAGAEIDVSRKAAAPTDWLAVAELDGTDHGTMISWSELDGITWTRARWGSNSGLIPNLEFEVGRVYRKLLDQENASFKVTVHVVDERFESIEEPIEISGNDPLYVTPGLSVPRSADEEGNLWPPDDPLFDDVTGTLEQPSLMIELETGEKVEIRWRASLAKINTFAQFNRKSAGSLPHGRHAKKNVGLSILREDREISLSLALANPSEPRERWFGVEIEIPHQLDAYLGMTNNKQEYTRLETVLRDDFGDYMAESESMQQCLDRIEKEDFALAVCLRIAWKTIKIWSLIQRTHINMRIENRASIVTPDPDDVTPEPDPDVEGEAESIASEADPNEEIESDSEEEKEKLREEIEATLIDKGVAEVEARQISARIVDRGLAYTIASHGGLGSVFFNVSTIKGVKMIELNSDHPAHSYLKSSMEEAGDETIEVLAERLRSARIATMLMLEAWAKMESDERSDQQRLLRRYREDWGRVLDDFVREWKDEDSD